MRAKNRRAESARDPRPSPHFPQLLSSHLHLSSTSASGRRLRPAPPTTNPALVWFSLSLGTKRPPPATSPPSSEPIGIRAPPLAPSPTHPGAPNGSAREGRENGRQPMGDARRAQGRRGAGAQRKGCRGGEVAPGGARELITAASGQVSAEPSVQGSVVSQRGS